jgi:tetratricopeptide (TPR) repeat protein
VRSIAITKGKIADILRSHGELDEALRIRTEEQLPVYERLGEVRSIAITKGKIADILQSRGELDEALRIRTQEELPVYERLGDQFHIARAKGAIADILESRGQLDEALRIRTEEKLPVYERLGDVRASAITKGQIADILQSRGQLDEALRIRTEEELPVYERLGDVREVGICKGKIADILQRQGDLDGALAMHLERLPVAQEMQDIDSIAHIRFSCAQIRLARGDHEKGDIQIVFEELIEAFEISDKLQRPDAIGPVGNLLGQVLALGGHPDEAVNILETAGAAFAKIGQADGAAQCRQLIAQIKGTRS